MKSIRNALRVSALVVICLGIASWAVWGLWNLFFYGLNGFSGDGQLSDAGMFSRPRFRLVFPDLQIDKDRSATFSFRGIPRDRFTFGLDLVDISQQDALDALKDEITVRAELSDERGNAIFAVRSPLSAWVRTWSQSYVFYWRDETRDLWLSPDRKYTVMVAFEVTAAEPPAVRLRPLIRGGGIELP